MEYTFYDYLFFFFIYGFAGWCCEVIYAAFKTGKFVNRGFLLGPICPIYGIGVSAVLYMLEPLKNRPVSVFIMSVLITSAVELLVGILAEKMFHQRLWDYSGRFMNIGGYICLTFSLMWGAGCMAVIYLVHPLIYTVIGQIGHFFGIIILCILSSVIITDTSLTVFHALRIPARMKAIEEISEKLEGISNSTGKWLSDGTLKLIEKSKGSEISQKYQALLEKRNIVHDHIFRAFDRMKDGKYKYSYEKIFRARSKKK